VTVVSQEELCSMELVRRIFECKREVTGRWRKLHSGGLHNLYSSPNIISVFK
jgi:hypothetical protein